jgi:DNA-binding NarL/FixJ family response regulator
MKRLMIVADHSLAVHAIRLALRQTAGFRVVGFFDGRGSIRQALVELNPDVVLVDDMQHTENALARMREISEAAPDAKSLLLTLRMEDQWLNDAFEAGADAVVSKTVHPVSLGTLLREICDGNVALRHQPATARSVEDDCPLTDRELEILRLVAEGYTNGRIAAELWVTEQTIKFHLSNTYRKLGVANRTEASRYAHLHALTSPVERMRVPRDRVA